MTSFSEDTNTFSSPELGQTWRLSRPSLQAGSHCHRGGEILETQFQTNFKCTSRCKLLKQMFPVLRLEFERHRHRVRGASWSCRLLCGAPDRHILYFKDTLGNGDMTLNKGRFHLRFSGIRPLRGPPPPPLNGKSV